MISSEQWAFHNPTRVRCGRGSRIHFEQDVAGQRVLAVSTRRGREQFTSDTVLGPLASRLRWFDTVVANPGIVDIENGLKSMPSTDFDVVVAFGGGSAIDFSKALASLIGAQSHGLDLRSLISEPEALLAVPILPIIALPTTSGTGSEVTPFATVWDHVNKKKLSLASPALFPSSAIVDAELTDGLPAASTFASGLDALNQAFESVWNKNRSPATLQLAGRAIRLALDALPRLNEDLSDSQARDNLAEASLLAGLCISQTKTALCHSMSYPLTAHFDIPHGVACAFTMADVMERCIDARPDIFDSVVRETSYGSVELLFRAVVKVVGQLDVSSQVTAAVGSFDNLIGLSGEMITPGRSANFILPVDDADIVAILGSSYNS